MNIIKPYYIIEDNIDGEDILKKIERMGRTCYKSEDLITNESAKEFVKKIMNLTHESVLEHYLFSVRFICDRGVSHELVRHRLASFSQESTRYCNYNKDKFNNQLTFIIPVWMDITETNNILIDDVTFNTDIQSKIWLKSMCNAEYQYKQLIENNWQPQQARSVLPNSLKTEIVMTANLREWRLIFKLRTANAAHPQMRELMRPLLDEIKLKIPIIFDDINYNQED